MSETTVVDQQQTEDPAEIREAIEHLTNLLSAGPSFKGLMTALTALNLEVAPEIVADLKQRVSNAFAEVVGGMLLDEIEYDLQQGVAEMMTVFGQEVRPLPKMIEDPKERLLAGNLIFEEAVEFVRALGLQVYIDENTGDPFLQAHEDLEPNLIEAADGIGDILVTTYGGANRLGILASGIFAEVNRSNKTKVWPDGTIHRRESDGKVIKPDTYSPADIGRVLATQEAIPYATRFISEAA